MLLSCRLHEWHGDHTAVASHHSGAKGAGLGLQLRVYRGVPLVNLNAIAPDKKVEVRPQVTSRLVRSRLPIFSSRRHAFFCVIDFRGFPAVLRCASR